MTAAHAAFALALLALLAPGVPAATSARRLLDNAQCPTWASSATSDCSSVVSQVQLNAASLASASDAQIKAAMGNVKPSTACCQSMTTLLKNGCRCNADVVELAKGMSLTAAGLHGVSRAAIYGCKLPGNTDTSAC